MTPPPKIRDTGNHLLDRIPADEFDRLAPYLVPATFTLREVVHQFEAEVESIYFPTTALVSLLTITPEDSPVEAATVGREGFVGVAASLGVARSPHRGICQMGGEAIRLPVGRLPSALGGPGLARVVRLYVAYSFRHASQMLACNALHPVETRASRWLLQMNDQAGSDEFPLTHEFLAYMLGVRRQGVTVVAGALQKSGLIAYHRGRVRIVDRPGLEGTACECYAMIRQYYAELFG